jgi:DNA-binding MarR family transcriptional regulator
MIGAHDETIETLLVSVNRLIRRAAQANGNPTSSAVWRTLGVLDLDGTMRIGELATASRVSQPTMTKLVAGMVADGLVVRRSDPDDSRVGIVAITDAGHDAITAWRGTLAREVGPLFADLDESQWNTLHAAAALIAARVNSTSTIRERVGTETSA